MRDGFGALTGLMAAAAIVLVSAAPAYALGAKATLANGVITVSGGQAAKSAPISWEGVVVTAANKGGSFTLISTYVPADCVGALSDGSASIDVRVEGCSGSITGLPGTGQVTIYAPGDDADVGAGGALSYRDNGDGTVTDIRTALSWEKKTDANVNSVYNWDDAFAYVAELNTMNGGAGFAGHNDWRLPNVRELLSIVDYGRSNPSIHPIFGPTAGVLNFVLYWSSTSWAAYQPAVECVGREFQGFFADLRRHAPVRQGQLQPGAGGAGRYLDRPRRAPASRVPQRASRQNGHCGRASPLEP